MVLKAVPPSDNAKPEEGVPDEWIHFLRLRNPAQDRHGHSREIRFRLPEDVYNRLAELGQRYHNGATPHVLAKAGTLALIETHGEFAETDPELQRRCQRTAAKEAAFGMLREDREASEDADKLIEEIRGVRQRHAEDPAWISKIRKDVDHLREPYRSKVLAELDR